VSGYQGSFAGAWLKLAATPTAVSIGRTLVEHSLGLWGLDHLADSATLIVSELLTNAVKATGIMESNPSWAALEGLALLAVQVRVQGRTLVVEAWDSSTSEPKPRTVNDDAEGGRGLFLVEAMSDRWDVCLPESGGKIVYAELNIDKRRGPAVMRPMRLPKRVRSVVMTGTGPHHVMADRALLGRVMEGLAKI
jgi:anti-sigma regulatory factor (Ser/Thr protein kinase)